MPSDLQRFVGALLKKVEKLDYSWFFRFDEPLMIVTESAWRLVTPERIAVTSEDHEEMFGLSHPVDASELALSGLATRRVLAVSFDQQTGDLLLAFADGLYLQFLQMSSGYESWRAFTGAGETICLGGGDLAHIAARPSTQTHDQG